MKGGFGKIWIGGDSTHEAIVYFHVDNPWFNVWRLWSGDQTVGHYCKSYKIVELPTEEWTE